ncbi:unnamed protein product [Ostreobium quekettii]|uniref:Malate dehydrogenase n=1 Tax=Ostreobium quekettii TaxID=121088 RepID=A0A8S1IWZ9_9CHLO|nr:unnamed protein product [Ostreobium quekettii]
MAAFLRAAKGLGQAARAMGRAMSIAAVPERKVAILGAAGGIGQPLALLMKMNPACTELALYDIANMPGVAADVSHVNTRAQVKAYSGDELKECLSGADVVVIPAGVPRKPGMTRQDLFKVNAGIVKSLVEEIAKTCPTACINMISNPVNSTVPIAAEILKRHNVYDKRKLMGVTTLDVVRAKTFYAERMGLNIGEVDVPVVGGHAGITILPLWSQATPSSEILKDDVEQLTKRTQDGGTEVVQAKAGKGSATLSMAYAGALFADACLRGLNGQKSVIECSYVESTACPGVDYFSTKVRLGANGVEEIYPIGDINEYEKEALDSMVPELNASIETGVKFAAENK